MGYEPGEGHGAVATASYEAREFGVESAQPISTALERLPRIDAVADPDPREDAGLYRPVDLDFYESVAADVREILHTEADVVREVSIDEAYLDVTERVSWETVMSWAQDRTTQSSPRWAWTRGRRCPDDERREGGRDRDKPDGRSSSNRGPSESSSMTSLSRTCTASARSPPENSPHSISKPRGTSRPLTRNCGRTLRRARS